jgi:hypothetical protein
MKARRILTGLTLGAAGVVFTVGAVFVVQAAQDQTRLTERTYLTADIACRDQMQKIGAVKEVEGGRVWELSVPVVVDKRAALGDASTAIAACPTRNMASFCLGSGCSDPEGARPPATAVRRPSSMVMRMALRPGAPAAPVSPAATPRPPGVPGQPVAQPAVPRPAVPVAQQPARPMTPPQPLQPQPQPARPMPGQPGSQTR